MFYQKREKSLLTWNEEFNTGHWTHILGMKRELPRYFVIRGYIEDIHPSPDILDLGCGQGTLLEHLKKYGQYVGIDFSEEALRLADKYANANTNFKLGDIESFQPNKHFDVILFNECLIYFDHPLKLLQRYIPYLNENGVFIVSNHAREASAHIWQQIAVSGLLQAQHEVTLSSGNESWDVKVYIPRQPNNS